MVPDSPTKTPHLASATIDFSALEPEARWVLDLLLLQEPDLPVEGLYRTAKEFFIVSENALRPRNDGKTFQQWFDYSVRPVGLPIRLVESCPCEVESVSPLLEHQLRTGFGEFRTEADLIRDIALALPTSFPLVEVRIAGRTTCVVVARALTPEEKLGLDTAYAGLGCCLRLDVEVSPVATDSPRKAAAQDMSLLPASYLPRQTPHFVRHAVESDEDLWRSMDSMQSLAAVASVGDLLNPWPEIQNVSCLVDTTFPPDNIRCYLSLYKTVVLVAPVLGHLERALAGLRISKEDLKALAVSGTVRILVPHSVDRYDLGWLADLLEAAPNSVMMSRRLALIALNDQHRRNPLFAFPSTTPERRAVLQWLRHGAEKLPGDAQTISRALGKALSDHWSFAERTLRARGAMASLSGGLARFGSALVSEVVGRDHIIEIGSAAIDVEWAGALGAHLVPLEGLGYSSAAPAALLIALSSGGIRGQPLLARSAEFELAKDLLAFDNDGNVVDFATELGRGDLARFRTVVHEIVTNSTGPEEVEEHVRAWNTEVQRYERRPDRVRRFNLLGVLAAASVSAASNNEILRSVAPVVALALPYLQTKATEDWPKHSRVLGTLLDWANGNAAGSSPRAVLLSRMRKQLPQ